jgi:hypothetical protein
MNDTLIYLDHFFNELEVFEDVARGHNYKIYIRQAVYEFLANETKQNALAVYEAFFDSYRIQLPGESNPFIDLLDMLRSYEENAATLIDTQRDHFIHSVNVFILGLCIYSQNGKYRQAFAKKIINKAEYPFSYDTAHEEFFYRWGIASLFHDVGYPVEIIGNQVTKFIDFATNVDSKTPVLSHLEFDNFEDLNTITEVIPKSEFIKSYFKQYDSCVYIDLLKPIDLLSQKIHISLGVDLKQVKSALDDFIRIMAKHGFIDHGFFSAIIVLRWYGFLIQRCRYNPEYFFHPVLDSASAILLHNYYKNVLMKPPFNRGCLSPFEHPSAFLLILCDELQEWNREAYGILSKKHLQAGNAVLSFSDESMDVTYLTKTVKLPEQFSIEKKKLLNKLLDMRSIFPKGFSIQCEASDELVTIKNEVLHDSIITPRPLLENLEKIAVAIHDLYNQNQRKRNPDKPLAHPRFSDLPDALKYSNLRQARTIAEKVHLLGWEIRPSGSKGEQIKKIPEKLVEMLAIVEHDEWVRERRSSGYVYGKEKDSKEKVSPYLVPYEELSDEIKEYDREAIRNIPALLELVGLSIFKEK